MKRLVLALLVLLPAPTVARVSVAPCRISGRVRFVSNRAYADTVVRRSSYAGASYIRLVTFPTRRAGEWQSVSSGEDYRVYIVPPSDRNQSYDYAVRFVDRSSNCR